MSVSSFPLACQVITLSQDELEVRFEQAFHLRPGQLLRFDREDGNRLYGSITALRVDASNIDSSMPRPVIAKIQVLLGEADLTLSQAHVLSADGLNDDVTKLIGMPDYPVRIGKSITVDFNEYQTLTLIHGSHLSNKLSALAHWLEALNPYQHIIVIDPLGVMQEELLDKAPKSFANLVKGGLDASLSLQNVGIKHFLSVLSTMLPDVIRNEAIQLLAEVLPIGQTFVPFRDLLRVETLTERKGDGPSRQALSMKTPLLNCLYEIDRQRVFADSPREVLSIPNVLGEKVTVIDLSLLSEPWKSLFYEELCLEILSNADSDIMPVLLYPENYLSNFSDYVKKLNEANLSALAVASPYLDPSLLKLADNRVYWNALGDHYLQGSLTFGLPVQLALGELPDAWEEIEGHRLPGKAPNPIQARYSQKAPIAAPAPLYMEDTPYDDTVYESKPQQSLWLDDKAVEEGDVIPEDSFDDTWKDTDADVEELSEALIDEPFDSILGSWQELDENESLIETTPSIEENAIPVYPALQAEDISTIPEYEAEEVGGQVIRAEPEFISGDDLKAHAPQLADAMLQALQNEETHTLSLQADQPAPANEMPISMSEATLPQLPEEQAGELLDDEFNFEFQWDETIPTELPVSTELPVYPEAPTPPVQENLPITPEPSPEQSSTILTEAPPIIPKTDTAAETGDGIEHATAEYQVGDRVISDKYGSGIVQKLIPMDAITAVHVLFDNGSKRTIVPSPTNLQKA